MNTASTPANFHSLTRRVRFTGSIEAKTGLRVGAGKSADVELSDLPVLRDRHGYPYLPGSSIKGVLRSTIEALLRGLPGPKHPVLWSCDPLQTEEKDDRRKACGAHEPEGRADAILEIPESCAPCRLFGSRVLSSHVRISDALQDRSDDEAPPVQRRDGVAIDRDLLVVHGKQKYDYDVVSVGTKFSLEIFVENPEDWELGLLTLGLQQLSDGFSPLGGFGSRGLGRVDLHLREFTETTAEMLLANNVPEVVHLESSQGEARKAKWKKGLADLYSSHTAKQHHV